MGDRGMKDDRRELEARIGEMAAEIAASLDALKDPAVVHLNMLRGGIAKPTPAQIGHLYRGEEAAEVIREVIRQNPEAAQAIVQLYRERVG